MPPTNKYVNQEGEFRRVHEKKDDGSYFIYWNKEKVPISKRRKFYTDEQVKARKCGGQPKSKCTSSSLRSDHCSWNDSSQKCVSIKSKSSASAAPPSTTSDARKYARNTKKRPRPSEYPVSGYKVNAQGQWRPVYQKGEGADVRYYYYYNDKYQFIRNQDRLIPTSKSSSLTCSNRRKAECQQPPRSNICTFEESRCQTKKEYLERYGLPHKNS